ncbi:Hypothetical protein RY67_774 [Bifidobacterium longum subsp. infantis]|uniref:Uncharacterized protein n=1 Tax=Bifidobacterium longum subsp. infantis TaxID=1682 RepID=A0A0M5KV11_BIFLI|nr:Hypothetical protein RY67_774 [Bifidobacterium longum subsp. infantis]
MEPPGLLAERAARRDIRDTRNPVAMICDDQASRRLCLRRYGYERPEWAGRHRLRLRHADEREAYSPRLRLQCDTPPPEEISPSVHRRYHFETLPWA